MTGGSRPVLGHALAAALRAYVRLLAIVAPTYVAVVLLKHSPALPWLAARMAPAMGGFGLPGEGALVLVLGLLINIYAAVAAIVGLDLTVGQVTTLALMLAIAHNLIVEGAILFRLLGRRGLLWILLRLALGAAVGVSFGRLFEARWPGPAGSTHAAHAVAAADPLGHELLTGGLHTALQLFLILLPIEIGRAHV